MKKCKQWMLAAILFCGSMGFYSCTDANDNPVGPVNPSVDPVTQESYINDQLMDRSVKPGDSFYDFALGTWLKNHDGDDQGLTNNVGALQNAILQEQFFNSSDPVVQHLVAYADKKADMTELLSILVDLFMNEDGSEAEPTRQEFLTTLAKLVDLGYTPMVKCALNTNQGRFVRVLTAGDPDKNLQNKMELDEDLAVEYIKGILANLQKAASDIDEMDGDDDDEDDEEDLDAIAQEIIKIEKVVANAQNKMYSDDLRLRQLATPKRALKPSQLPARSRGTDGITEADVYQALGITDDNSLVDEMVQPVIDLILTEDVKTLNSYLNYHVIASYIDLVADNSEDFGDFGDLEDLGDLGDFGGFGDYQYPSDDNVRESLYETLQKKAPELLSRVDYAVLAEDIDIEGCRTLMEQMRTLMDQRISALDWMSEATKSAARQKLAAMKFNIGLPNAQPGEQLRLTGETLLEDVQQLRQQRQQALMNLVGKPIADLGWDMMLQYISLGTVNAMYAINLNQLFILPAFLGNSLFPKDNEVMRYAVTHVFGHEMCHGFDANGANYDENGTVRDWWAPADLNKFLSLQQQMVELYNQLWQCDGVHANGLFTLEENMADLGGVRLAFELYRQKLVADGLNIEEMNHQLREFFLHFALIWQEDPSQDDLMEALTDDEHSTGRNRIIGITRLMDEWYELFNVTDGQWYLNPSDRVKIW